MKKCDYRRVATVVTFLLIVIGFTFFTFVQLQPKTFQPPGAISVKKTVRFLVTSPVPYSYLAESAGEEATIYVRSRETARIRIQQVSQAPEPVKNHPTYGLFIADANLFELEGSLYLGLMPARIGSSTVIETPTLSVQAIIYSIED